MKVKVEYLGHIRNVIGCVKEEEVEIKEGSLITDLLMVLSEKYREPFKKAVYEPRCGDVKSNFMVTINGYLLNQLNGVKTKLKNGDHIVLMPIVSGG